jgi:uncharacterized membrane protein
MAMMLVTGILLFFSEALKCYGNTSFRIKMIFLAAAVIFQFTVYSRVIKRGEAGACVRRVSTTVALLLWFGVGLGGRAIGFLG